MCTPVTCWEAFFSDQLARNRSSIHHPPLRGAASAQGAQRRTSNESLEANAIASLSLGVGQPDQRRSSVDSVDATASHLLRGSEMLPTA